MCIRDREEVVHHLVFTGYRLNEFRMCIDMLDQSVCILDVYKRQALRMELRKGLRRGLKRGLRRGLILVVLKWLRKLSYVYSLSLIHI